MHNNITNINTTQNQTRMQISPSPTNMPMFTPKTFGGFMFGLFLLIVAEAEGIANSCPDQTGMAIRFGRRSMGHST
jgi:hypothetical protein